MSMRVEIDYRHIAIQCESICEIAEEKLSELDRMMRELENTSTRIFNEQAQLLKSKITKERLNLAEQIKDVRGKAGIYMEKEKTFTDDMSGEAAYANNFLGAAENLQRTVDVFSSRKLIEFDELLRTLLLEKIRDVRNRIPSGPAGIVRLDDETRNLLSSIADESLRQFTYLAFLRNPSLRGDDLMREGSALMNETYESRYEKEVAKIREELENSRIEKSKIDDVMSAGTGSERERLMEIRKAATKEIVDEKVRKKTLSVIIKAIADRGFVIDRKNIRMKPDTNEVVMVALKASGEKAEFRIFLDGRFIYDFHGYRGQACRNDIEPFMKDLEEVYGLRVIKQQEIWSNPDKISTMKYNAVKTNKSRG